MVPHRWPEVHARSENVAEWLLDEEVTALGMAGEPTVELIAAILGAFQAGAAVTIAPSPVRGADTDKWAQSTVARFAGMGVSHVLTRGSHLEQLALVDRGPVMKELDSVATLTNCSPRRTRPPAPPASSAPGPTPTCDHRSATTTLPFAERSSRAAIASAARSSGNT